MAEGLDATFPAARQSDAYGPESLAAQLLAAMPAGVLGLDGDFRVRYANAQVARTYGRPRTELIGSTFWELFPAELGGDLERACRAVLADGGAATVEAYAADRGAWFETRVWPCAGGLALWSVDVTERRLAQDRAELLGSVTSELGAAPDIDTAAALLARLLAPGLADWCVVSLLDDETSRPTWQRLVDVSSWHADPAGREAADRYAQHRLAALTEASFLGRALRSGAAQRIPDATRSIAALLLPGPTSEALTELAPAHGVVQPLSAHGRTLGLLTLFRTDVAAPFTDDDLAALATTASRAAVVMDNTRLHAQQRELAEALQRSLLTAPPRAAGEQVVVRYVPAADAAQVGGDWYDAFPQADGATVLVIGDVVGHDTAAAAAMGQVRGLLRGIAATTGEGPAAVLGRLDAALSLLRVETTATAVVARLERGGPGETRLRWCNAGHPPPLLIGPDGAVSVAGADPDGEGDLLLGIDPRVERREWDVALASGSTVLLYTDGLVERRGQSLDVGVARLAEVCRPLAGRPLDELCDSVLARMLPRRSEDDVALVAVRLGPDGC